MKSITSYFNNTSDTATSTMEIILPHIHVFDFREPIEIAFLILIGFIIDIDIPNKTNIKACGKYNIKNVAIF